MWCVWRWVVLGLALSGVPFVLGVSGCSSPLHVDQGAEIDIGREAATQVETQVGVVHDPVESPRVERIGLSIARVSTRPKLPWSYQIVDVKEVNAFSLPGGPVYVTRGLLALGVSDDELAGVLGHETAHIQLRHAAKDMERAMRYNLLEQLALGGSSDLVQAGADMALQLALVLPHSRQDEYQADAVGTRLAVTAGYAPDGLLRFLRRLDALHGGSHTPTWLQTHPLTQDRIAREEALVAELAPNR